VIGSTDDRSKNIRHLRLVETIPIELMGNPDPSSGVSLGDQETYEFVREWIYPDRVLPAEPNFQKENGHLLGGYFLVRISRGESAGFAVIPSGRLASARGQFITN
jgi:hypothetical protein